MQSPPAQSDQFADDLMHFFDQSIDMLCIAGLDGYLKRVNPAWTTHLGWTEEELLAKPFLDIVHRDDCEFRSNIWPVERRRGAGRAGVKPGHWVGSDLFRIGGAEPEDVCRGDVRGSSSVCLGQG